MPKRIQSLTGPVDVDSLGLILPHEHLFRDLRGPLVDGYPQAEPVKVVRVVEPYLAEAATSGVTALVECSTVGVERNLTILSRLAEVSPIRIIAPTGVYRDAFTPPSLRDAGEADLADLCPCRFYQAGDERRWSHRDRDSKPESSR